MAEIKTRANDVSVDAYIASVEDPVRRADAVVIRELMEQVSGFPAVMWGTSIVGFGSYRYKGRSSSGDWPVLAFSPRKATQSLYGLHGAYVEGGFVETLGKHTIGKGCIYVKRLSDVDLGMLESLIAAAMAREPDAAV